MILKLNVWIVLINNESYITKVPTYKIVSCWLLQ